LANPFLGIGMPVPCLKAVVARLAIAMVAVMSHRLMALYGTLSETFWKIVSLMSLENTRHQNQVC